MRLATVGRKAPGMTYLKANPFLGPCSPSTSPCSARFDMSVATPRCCVDQHVNVIKVVAPLLDKAGVRWWIDYGMLLGYAVNGGYYWNDRDIDISVLAEDRDKVREIAKQLSRSHRYWIHYKPLNEGKPWSYSDCVKVSNSMYNRATLDITFWDMRNGLLDRKAWASVDKYKGRETPVDWVFPVVRGMWEGVSVNVPRESTRLVEYRYGDKWKNLPAVRVSGELREGYPVPSRTAAVPPALVTEAPREYFGRPRAECEVTDPEGLILKKYAGLVPEGQTIVEIGAYKGRSMCWLAAGSHEGKKAPVFSVDLWEEGTGYALTRNGGKVKRPYAKHETRLAYEALRNQYGHGLVTPIRGRSADTADRFDDEVGMLFIDGDHTYAGVSADVKSWLPKVAEGGVIAFHDMNAPGVLRTISEQLQGWEKVESTRLVAVFTRKENEQMRFLDTQGGRRARKFLAGKAGTGPVENKAAPVVDPVRPKRKGKATEPVVSGMKSPTTADEKAAKKKAAKKTTAKKATTKRK